MGKITVYTDGSTIRNGKADSACGWACKLMWKGKVLVKSGGDIGKTNNQMEMKAVLEAMRSITDKSIPVEVYSDSKYVVETLNGKYRMRKNQGLWHSLLIEKDKFNDIKFIWIKGHDKDEHNNEVDRLAVSESQKGSKMEGVTTIAETGGRIKHQ